MSKIFTILFLFFLISCSSTVEFSEPIVVSTPSGIEKISGKYAAYIQTGGWQLETEAKTLVCGAWTFSADINEPYVIAAKQTLSQMFDDITFYNNILSAEEMKNENYLGQISILQTSARATFGFTGAAQADFIFFLNTIVSAQNSEGLMFQENVEAEGLGQETKFLSCNAQEGARIAVQNSIEQLLDISSMHIYNGLKK